MNKWNQLSNEKTLNETTENIKARGINVILVDNKAQALEKIKQLIPKDAEVYNGSSTTLAEIGFVDYLKAARHGWKNLHEAVLKEKDQLKQASLRRKFVTA